MDRFGVEDPMTMLLLNHFIFPLRQPIADSVQQFHSVYHLALGSGDVGLAFQASNGMITAMIHSGAPLEEIERNARSFNEEALLLNQSNARRDALPMWQFALNLLGQDCANPVLLNGEAMEESEVVKDMEETNNQLGLAIFSLIKLILAYLFEDWTTAASLMKKVDGRRNPLRKHYSEPICETYIGLCNYAMARLHPTKARYRTRARRATVALRQRVKKEIANTSPLYSLLKAHTKFEKKDFKTTIMLLECCILEARTNSFLHWEAIASEMLMKVLRESPDSAASSSHYFDKAKSLYKKWGAHSKALWLDKYYQQAHLSGSEEIDKQGASSCLTTTFKIEDQ